MVRAHGEPQLQVSLDYLNGYHHSIKFTAEWSRETVSFLDMSVFLVDGQIRTDLYCKPTS